MESPKNTRSISPFDAAIWSRFCRRRFSHQSPRFGSFTFAPAMRVAGTTGAGRFSLIFSKCVFAFEYRFFGHGSLPSDSA